ncbi:META domain-containing protein [Thiothrix fructosivorans]|uniref:META domain-containing protein n=1 Tax=Thiothrix fructosivorans TaxID=111770 RepID=A0A8B0SJA0_9GAMM|nr:META domain-containing protein [Thiothrix fructosivorans]MBO0613144.1 META domain-containing protein [Thiothrix fructosivorans]QTX11416.1 META domain-containing protein [Thiothrix fructosivorans]
MLKTFFPSVSAQMLGVLAFLAIISACSLDTEKAVTPMTLSGTQWDLKTLSGQTVKTDKLPTIQFDTSRMNGYAGCNQFFGNYTGSSDGVFSSSGIGATKMACMGDKSQLEQQFFAQLAKTSQYAIVLDQLHLLDNDRNILMVLSAAKPAKPTAQ